MPEPTTTLRVRLLQTDPVLGDVAGNLARLDSAVAGATGADLVVTPELATHGAEFGDLDDPVGLAPTDHRLRALGEHGPAVVVGFAEAHRHHLFNSAAVVAGGGVGVQRKLYPPNYRSWEERKHFRPGNRVRCHDVAGARLAAVICNDLWQPPVPWLAAHDGAEVVLVLANSAVSEVGVPTDRVWRILLLHTAMALQTFVVFVNRVGDESGKTYWGGSRVIHPSGDVLASLDAEAGHVDCEVDLAEVRALRRRWPLLQESRADLVAREAARLAGQEWDEGV